MADEWLEAARTYNRLDDLARAEYWKQLTPDQQLALRNALASLPSNTPVASPAVVTSPPARSGCSSPLAAGCLGMILGCLLTLGVEAIAIIMGVQALSDLVNKTSDIHQPAEDSGSKPDDGAMTPNDQLLRYCGTERESSDSAVAAACAAERRDQELREQTVEDPGE